jgi:hypothetical protein
VEFDNSQESSDTQSQDLSQTEAPTPESEQATTVQELLDLDKVERFRMAGQEWTPKDLQGAILRQADYTRKTQELSKQRKYYDSLDADLEAVKADPRLAEQFRKVYPETFHKFLGYAGVNSPKPIDKPQQQQTNANGLPKEFVERLDRIEGSLREREVKAIEAEIDSKFQTFSQKYPLADESAVLARAEALARQGQKMTDDLWDDLWSSVHKRTEELMKKHYSAQFKGQVDANKRGADAAPGGAIPAQKPLKARSIKEMTDQLLSQGGGF